MRAAGEREEKGKRNTRVENMQDDDPTDERTG
jgi:hypothetical protein